jgi:beta-mannosidase
MRTLLPLRSAWYLRSLDPGTANLADLSRQALDLRPATAAEAGWLPTAIPALVHDVLRAHGLLPDPAAHPEAPALAEVAARDWLYATSFPSPEPCDGPVRLRLLGLDTLATVALNGEVLASCDDAFREVSLDVTARLAPAGGRNALLILFPSPLAHLAALDPPPGIPAHRLLRKPEVDWSPRLGGLPNLVRLGIQRDVALDLCARAWIDDVSVRTVLDPSHLHATVHVQAEVSRRQAWLHWSLADPSGAIVARGDSEAWRPVAIRVERPALWWPHTIGQPHLYALSLQLTSEGEPCEERYIWVGIRDVRLEERDPSSLAPLHRYVVNGRPVFLQGACWAAPPGLSHCPDPARDERLLDMARHANMNALRVVAGGPLPEESFYDGCDRRGILVLQDLPFAPGPYPEDDAALARNARAEVEGIVRRLRNHACLLAWTGRDRGPSPQAAAGVCAAGPLLGRAIPEVVARLDPSRRFRPATPGGGPAPNWPLRGDWQDDTARTFSPWGSLPAFAAALGRVSAPALPTLRRALGEDALWPAGHDAAPRAPGQPAWPASWARHAPADSWDQVGPLERYCVAGSAAELVRTLGSAQADYLRERLERHRRGQPDGAPLDGRRCWGSLVWRLVDPWPSVGPGLIDADLVPKIAWYAVRRACAPVLLSFERTADEISLWVVNDSAAPLCGTLTLRRLRFDGTLLGEARIAVDVAPGVARRRLSATPFGPLAVREELLAAALDGWQACLLLAPERVLRLPAATLRARLVPGGVEVSADLFARQVSLAVPGSPAAAFEDNYLDLLPQEARRIAILEAPPGATLEVRAVNAAPLTIDLP